MGLSGKERRRLAREAAPPLEMEEEEGAEAEAEAEAAVGFDGKLIADEGVVSVLEEDGRLGVVVVGVLGLGSEARMSLLLLHM